MPHYDVTGWHHSCYVTPCRYEVMVLLPSLTLDHYSIQWMMMTMMPDVIKIKNAVITIQPSALMTLLLGPVPRLLQAV